MILAELSLRVSEVNEPLNLQNGEAREAVVNLLNTIAKLKAVHYGVGHNTSAPHNGSA